MARLPQSRHPFLGNVDELGIGVGANDDLDEFGHRHRVEEMQSDERLRSRQSRSEFVDRQCRGVRADGGCRSMLRDGREHLLLEFDDLRHGFDD
jgi:hypothetical protein